MNKYKHQLVSVAWKNYRCLLRKLCTTHTLLGYNGELLNIAVGSRPEYKTVTTVFFKLGAQTLEVRRIGKRLGNNLFNFQTIYPQD